jgi:hypothetical protein
VAFSLREVRRALTAKLKFEMKEGQRHPTFVYWHQGVIVAKTHISHGSGRDVTEGVVSAMARQLGVTGPQLRDAISCSLSPETFSGLLMRNRR